LGELYYSPRPPDRYKAEGNKKGEWGMEGREGKGVKEWGGMGRGGRVRGRRERKTERR